MPHIEALNDNIPLTNIGNPQGHVITSRNPNASHTPLRAIRINSTTTMTLTPTFTGPVLVTSGKGTISETLRKTEKAISWLDRAIQGTELGGNILSIYSLPIPLNIGPLVHCLKQMLEFVRSGLENQVDALNLVIDCYNHVNSLRTQLMCRVGSPSLVIQNVVDGLTQKLQKNVDLLAALSNQSSLKRMWRSTQSRRSLIAAREDTCRYLDEINLQLNIMQSQKLDQQHDLIYGLTKRIAQLERAFRGSDLVAGSARMLYVDRYTLVIQEEEAEFCKLLGCLNGPNFPDTRLMVGDLKLRIIDSFSQMPWKGNRLEILGFLINLAILYQLLSAKIAPLIETENIAQGMPIYFVQQYCQNCMRLVKDLMLVPRSWSSRLMNWGQVQGDLEGMRSQLAQKVAPLSLDVAILVTQMQSDASYQKAIGQGLFVETLQRYSGDPRSIREVVKTRAEMAELQLALQRRLDEYILTTSMSARSLSTARSGTAQLEFSFDANILECIAEDNIHSLPDWVIPECELHRVETLKDLSSSRCIWKNSSVFVKELHEDIDPSSFVRAIEVMRRTRHRYIQPFLGASAFAGPKPWYIVTAWNERRSLEHEMAGPGCIDRLSIAYRIAQGMEYLHSRGIIHGNLHCGNVLLAESGQPIVCDYAYTPLKREAWNRSDRSVISLMQRLHRGEPLQNCLSELLELEGPPAKSGDVYAFAVIVYRLYVPGTDGETRMLRSIRQNQFGLSDDSLLHQPIGMTDDMYRLLQRCWARVPDERPSFQAIREILQEMSEAEYLRGTLIPLLWQAGHLPTQRERCGCRQPDFETSRKYHAFFDFNNHDYGSGRPLLNFPLWEPKELSIGDIGYGLGGYFIRLGSIHEYMSNLPAYPNITTEQKIMSINRTHRPPKGSHLLELISSVSQDMDAFMQTQGSRGHLPCDHQVISAQLVLLKGKLRWSTAISRLKEMFVAQIENILAQVSPEHGKLEKSDILLIVGALRVRDFAIGVANCTANEPIDGVIHTGRAQSSATPNQKPKSSRGKVPESSNADPTATTTKSTGSQNIPGEVYEPKDMALEWLENVYRVGNPYCAVKVSHPDGPQLDVCLSVLRFAPGADEPTIYRD